MPNLRKMLGNVQSEECRSLMRLMETQSKRTLANWAVAYAKAYYLPVFEAECPEDRCLAETVAACESYGKGQTSLNELKPLLREAAQVARALADRPVAQAAARAVSVACSTVQTPTNALGYLFYGAAAIAYSQAGLDRTAEEYEELAAVEFQRAYASLQKACIPDEPHPAKLHWNC